MASGSPLSQFCNTLIRFFEELKETFPEEREIRLALETIQNAKKINPGLVRDMFYEHVTSPLRDAIVKEDDQAISAFARGKISQQFNEILPAISIFDKHWATLSDDNRQIIWKYLKVLIVLNQKARDAKNQY
jgi:hypothetical protein